jgi:hypothetical protein
MRYLFLDIDGVLNIHESHPEVLCGQIHKDKVALLNDVLRATDAKIVLSSAWRYIVYRGEATLAGMDWLLRSHGVLAGRLVGITREDTMVRPPVYDGHRETWPLADERGQQITDWIAVREYQSYAVVDDLDLGITASGHPFVRTDGGVGLTRADADKLVELLRKAPW